MFCLLFTVLQHQWSGNWLQKGTSERELLNFALLQASWSLWCVVAIDFSCILLSLVSFASHLMLFFFLIVCLNAKVLGLISKEADGEPFDYGLAYVVALVVGCLLQMDNDCDLQVSVGTITVNLRCPGVYADGGALYYMSSRWPFHWTLFVSSRLGKFWITTMCMRSSLTVLWF